MRLCARRVSGAAHREQRCGFVVMDGWRPAAFRILAQEADDRPKSLSPRWLQASLPQKEGRVLPRDAFPKGTQLGPLLLFLGNEVSSPPRS